MCAPLLIAGATALLSVGSAVASHIGQNQMAAANRKAAFLTESNKLDIIQQKGVQLNAEKSEKALDTSIASAQAEGRIASSATEQGLAPGSVMHSLNTSMFGIGRQAEVENQNDANARLQLANESQGAAIDRNAQIAKVPKSSPMSLVLGVGQGVLAGANSYKSAGGSF